MESLITFFGLSAAVWCYLLTVCTVSFIRD